MKSTGAELTDLRSLSGAAWFERLRRIGDEQGSFERLGDDHASLYCKGSSTLLVTFETVPTIRRNQVDQLPYGLSIARNRGWSHLCLIADGPTWFRDPSVYAFFDRLVDDCFFDAFDTVLFYGSGMCGYGAAAFSVAAPGSVVVAVQPQATLDPALTGWDPRWPEMRRTSFDDRYGYAPDMIEGAASVFVIYDPEQTLDSMHAALFARSHVTLLPCRSLGRDAAAALDGMRVLPSVLQAAAMGTLDRTLFRTFYRARRNYPPYIKNLLSKLDNEGRMIMAGLVARNAVKRLNQPQFEIRLTEIELQLARVGERLPISLV